MFVELEKFNTGWVGLKIGLKGEEIEHLIQNLQMLKENPSQHFHIANNFKEKTGVIDIEIYPDENIDDNMELTGRMIEPTR